jgi:sugar O-acyltransferase (sialic acid O-acetyltransferase NeuD family)
VPSVVVFGVGSSLVADLEEGLARAGVELAAAVRNTAHPPRLLDPSRVVVPEELGPELLALPHLVPLFTPANRRAAAAEAGAAGFARPYTLVDPTAVVPPSANCGAGVWVNAGCVIGAATVLEDFALVNRGAGIGHHARLGPYASVGPGAVLTGHVTLEAGATVAAGAVVLPERTVGADAVVGAGAVVTRDVPPGTVAVGNPARVVGERDAA